MPSTGFYLFLPEQKIQFMMNEMCQCPQRASTYFFKLRNLDDRIHEAVSMPSTGFYLFLLWQHYLEAQTDSCVNALNGLLLISSRKYF